MQILTKSFTCILCINSTLKKQFYNLNHIYSWSQKFFRKFWEKCDFRRLKYFVTTSLSHLALCSISISVNFFQSDLVPGILCNRRNLLDLKSLPGSRMFCRIMQQTWTVLGCQEPEGYSAENLTQSCCMAQRRFGQWTAFLPPSSPPTPSPLSSPLNFIMVNQCLKILSTLSYLRLQEKQSIPKAITQSKFSWKGLALVVLTFLF